MILNKRKICVVITARPSYSRIKTALIAMKKHPKIELQIVLAASALLERYGSAHSIIEKDGFKIDAKVYNIIEGENLTSAARTTGIGIVELASVFERLSPDAIVTIADRFETIATAIAASYMNIPLIHIQGGEVTGNIDEKVRHAITKLADLHLVASPKARERVIKMGEHEESVYLTGCPSIDIAKGIENEFTIDLFDKYQGVGNKIDINKPFLVVLQHPVTTEYENSRKQVEITLKAIYDTGLPTIWFWPNVDAGSDGTSKGIRIFREKNSSSNIFFLKNMEPHDFLMLLKKSKCLIGNSSVGIRESAYLGVPVINIGSRQSGRERGINVIDVDYDVDQLKLAIKFQLDHGKYEKSFIYGDGNAGDKIAEVIAEAKLTFHKQLSY
jgi:UDP-hydrolysing UDP-N-acetyl-D-glucosamine 2-epimerase